MRGDLAKRTLSPRGYIIFSLVMVALFSLAGLGFFTKSGPGWSYLVWAAETFGPGDGTISAKLAVVLLIVPAMAIAAAAAYLHDFVFRLGLFAPKQPQSPTPSRPHDRLRDW
jgi:hypothetical protein